MLSFTTVWSSHPGRGSSPCNVTDQCAVRMGIALKDSSVDLKSYTGLTCKKAYPGYKHDPGHIMRAEELANWISNNIGVFGKKQVFKNVTSIDFASKKGIVFVKDGWGAGDHIDLWNGSEMKGGYSDYFSKGREIWFWELK